MKSQFTEPTALHKKFGILPIENVKVLSLQKSDKKNKKYMITIEHNNVIKTIHYGDSSYQHFRDRTNLKLFSSNDHDDPIRRMNYLARASKIRDKHGKLTANDAFSPNRYAILTFW